MWCVEGNTTNDAESLETRREQAIVDHYKTEEILFLGPDEGTADVMDWASQRAKERGASFWKAFTTGKSRSLGGIPHVLLPFLLSLSFFFLSFFSAAIAHTGRWGR